MVLRQFPAAISRSAGLSSKRTNLPASANVDADTGTPDAGAVPNAGGAPGGSAAGSATGLRHAAAAAERTAADEFKNCRREFDMLE